MKKNVLMLMMMVMVMTAGLFAESADEDSTRSPWKKELTASLNLSQASFDNWSQGGENSLAWQINVTGKIDREKDNTHWSNFGKFVFGQSKTGDENAKTVLDEIKLESVYTIKLNTPVHPYASVSARTQTANGYVYEDAGRVQISDFMDPGYFREAVGLNYLPNEHFKTRIGAAMKQTKADVFAAAYSDDPETEKIETLRDEIGMEWVSDLTWKLDQNLSYVTKMELFSAFEGVKETDVEWDNVLTAQINQYINCSFNFKLFYDKQISPKRQIKQSLSMGISYNFF